MKRLMLLTLIVALLLTAPTFAQTTISLSSQSKSTDLLTLISLDRVKDAEKIEEIIGGFKGKSIELYLATAFVEPYRNYKTRFTYLLYAVYGDEIKMSGPTFMFRDVSYLDLHLEGENQPESFDVGLVSKVHAEVEEMTDGFIMLEPISIEVVSYDDAARESVMILTKAKEQSSSDYRVSGFDSATNQAFTWCGVDFSFPSYLDVQEVVSDTWTYFYPEQEDYYASLMFQSANDIESQSAFDAALPNIIQSTFFSDERLVDTEVISSEAIEIAGLSGWAVTFVVKEENGTRSFCQYAIAYNPATYKVLMLSCMYDDKDQSNFDYLGDFSKMIEAAKLSNASLGQLESRAQPSLSIYEHAFARKFQEYTLYLLLDIDGEVFRSFATNDSGVMVGLLKGDLAAGITLFYDFGGKWQEVIERKPGSETMAILTDSDGFVWEYKSVPVDEAEAYLRTDRFHDMQP